MEWLPLSLHDFLCSVEPIKLPDKEYRLLHQSGKITVWWANLHIPQHFQEYGYNGEINLEPDEVEKLNEILKRCKLYQYNETVFYTSKEYVKVFLIKNGTVYGERYCNTWQEVRRALKWL